MKSKLTRPQFLTFVFAAFLVVLILLLPKIPGEKKSESQLAEEPVGFPIQQMISSFREELSTERKGKITFLEKKLKEAESPEDQMKWCDSLALHWKIYGKPEIEAEYLERYAGLNGSSGAWFVAGDAYFNNFRNSEEKFKKYMIGKAIECYQHISELEPDNLNAKNAIGVCYVEGAAYLGEPPMKGIGIIREVLAKDPENIDALVNLGYFAIKSGQYEKAIERYEQVLKIDSNHIEAYLYLTDIYVRTAKREKAVATLEKYKGYVKDQEKVAQIDNYIEEIKKSK